MILGSVSNYIMHHATCSVTVIHHRDRDELLDSVAGRSRSAVTTAYQVKWLNVDGPFFDSESLETLPIEQSHTLRKL